MEPHNHLLTAFAFLEQALAEDYGKAASAALSAETKEAVEVGAGGVLSLRWLACVCFGSRYCIRGWHGFVLVAVSVLSSTCICTSKSKHSTQTCRVRLSPKDVHLWPQTLWQSRTTRG